MQVETSKTMMTDQLWTMSWIQIWPSAVDTADRRYHSAD